MGEETSDEAELRATDAELRRLQAKSVSDERELRRLSRETELLAGRVTEQDEYIRLYERALASDSVVDEVRKIVLDYRALAQGYERRAAGAANASESRRVRIQDLELSNRRLMADVADARATSATLSQQLRDLRGTLHADHVARINQRLTNQRHQLAKTEVIHAQHGRARGEIYDALGLMSVDVGVPLRDIRTHRNALRVIADLRRIAGPNWAPPVNGTFSIAGGVVVSPNLREFASLVPSQHDAGMDTQTALKDLAARTGSARRSSGYSIYGPGQRPAAQPKAAQAKPVALRQEAAGNAYRRSEGREPESGAVSTSSKQCEYGATVGPGYRCRRYDGHEGDHNPTTAHVAAEAMVLVDQYRASLRNARDETISGLNA